MLSLLLWLFYNKRFHCPLKLILAENIEAYAEDEWMLNCYFNLGNDNNRFGLVSWYNNPYLL